MPHHDCTCITPKYIYMQIAPMYHRALFPTKIFYAKLLKSYFKIFQNYKQRNYLKFQKLCETNLAVVD